MSEEEKKEPEKKTQVEEKKVDKGPNEDWKNDPNLDDNGNPKEKITKDAPKKEEETKPEGGDKSKDDKEHAREYDLSSPVATQVEKLLVEAGLDVAEVAKQMNNDSGSVSPELIKAVSEKHGEAVASIVLSQLQTLYTQNKNAATKQDAEVFSQVQEAFKGTTEQSGEETWKELSGWAKDNVKPDERKEINALLKQGGLAAKLAVQELITAFKGTSQETQQADLLSGDTVTSSTTVPLSRREYTMELDKLLNSGHVYGESQKIAALDKRRAAGTRRNI